MPTTVAHPSNNDNQVTLLIDSSQVSNHISADLHGAQMLPHIRNTAPHLLQRLQSGLSKLPLELVWAAHAQWPLLSGHFAEGASQNSRRPIRISVLDSSFNPPTLAHLALANSPRPRYGSEVQGEGNDRTSDYDAKLLLLSVKNADKTLKPGDATYVQRLEMMGLLAQDVRTQCSLADGGGNVAIAIIDEPTFVGKSRVLQEYLQSRLSHFQPSTTTTSPPAPATLSTQLTFLIGMDTLERLFSPRYYPPARGDPMLTAEQTMFAALSRMLSAPPDGDDSLLVCAKRMNLPSDTTQKLQGESVLNETVKLAAKMGWLQLPGAAPEKQKNYKETNFREDVIPKDERIVLIDIGDRESRFSSTAVRNARSRIGLGGLEGGGGPWRQWLPKRVADYVEKEKLFLA